MDRGPRAPCAVSQEARRALSWCEKLGDRDGDGFQEYETRSTKGYYNQGWKDSEDAVVHSDGRKAETPLATVELQGYLFAAYLAVAELLTKTERERNQASSSAKRRRFVPVSRKPSG